MIIVEAPEQFREAIRVLSERLDWTVDSETDGFDPYNLNELCGIGIMPTGDEDHMYYFPFRHKQGTNLPIENLKELMEMMSTRRMLVGHNIKFDLHFFSREGLDVDKIRLLVDTAMMVRLTEPTWTRRVGLEETIRSDYGEKAASYDPIAKKALAQGKWHKDFSLSPISLLGPYCLEDILFTDRIYRDRLDKIKSSDQIDIFERQVALTPVLYRMERRGLQIDEAYANVAVQKLKDRIESLRLRAHKLAGEPFLITSGQQLGKVFNDKFNIHSPVLTEKTQRESWSEAALITINHPLAGIVRQAQSLRTVKSTFMEPYCDMKICHPSFNQFGTITGRLSSSNPNAQNIPRGITILADDKLTPDRREKVKELVDAIITTKGYDMDAPEFDDEVWDLWGYLSDEEFNEADEKQIHARRNFVARPGYRLVGFDYSQMEVRVFLSYLNTDKATTLLYSDATDFHGEGAKVAFKVDEDHPNWAFYRQAAKTLTFGIIYGQGLLKIATQLGFIRKYKSMGHSAAESITLGKAEAKKYRDEYFANMDGSRTFLNQVGQTIKSRGWVKNRYGRKYTVERDFGYKAVNYLVQGTSADIMNERIVEVDKFLADKKSNILLQVHDELVLEVHDSERDSVPWKVQEIMETNTLNIPLKVEVEEFPVSWAVKESRIATKQGLLDSKTERLVIV